MADANRSFLNVAPELALVYRPDAAWALRGRVATGYTTPAASNLFITPAGLPGNAPSATFSGSVDGKPWSATSVASPLYSQGAGNILGRRRPSTPGPWSPPGTAGRGSRPRRAGRRGARASFYRPPTASSPRDSVIAGCVEPDAPAGHRPHHNGAAALLLQLDGKVRLDEAGR